MVPTAWAPVGQTPVVITTGERKTVNMVRAISPRGELRFRIQEGKMKNAGKFIDFLKALLDSVPERFSSSWTAIRCTRPRRSASSSARRLMDG